jgi:hypothetical protein
MINGKSGAMGTLLNNDDAIWLKTVTADQATVSYLRELPPGGRIRLAIEGTPGDWEKMADGRDGRPTFGLKPIGRTREYWKTLRGRRGKLLDFKVLDPRDALISDIETALAEWDSKEDEVAFRDL